ncbi:aldo/keto reductase [Croceicoccus sediminis]|uniref:aldo/keto reductase n=1 Tax=Croceicoccus sediminis TaxID=2571150 RepID=UPI00196ABB24|nr:aldo/keto reductase [Croceicoccus sediminis]
MAMPGSVHAFTTRAGQSVEFTALGFGTACLGNYRKKLSDDEALNTLEAGWEMGLRYFDTAPFYGFSLAERRLGQLLSAKPRDSFTLSTKVGRILEPCDPSQTNQDLYLGAANFIPQYDYSYDGVMRSYEESLARIGVERIDILYVHDIDALVHGGREAAVARTRELFDTGGWKALSELRDNGDVKAVGIGVNEWQPCKLMLELADPDLFLLAGRYTLIETEPLETLFPKCEARGVGIVIGGPYNSGILAGGETYNYGDVPDEVMQKVAKVRTICADHGVTLPAAALQFAHAPSVVTSVIPGPMSVEEVRSNGAFLQEEIPPAFWRSLKDEGVIPDKAPVPI